MWVVSRVFLLRVIASLMETLASVPLNKPLEFVWVGLYIAPTATLTPDSQLGNITEANYDGYARQEAVWYPPFFASSGNAHLEGVSLHFTPTDAAVSNVITGVFVTDQQVGGQLLMSIPVGGLGVPLAGPQNAMIVDPQFDLSFSSNYGRPDISS